MGLFSSLGRNANEQRAITGIRKRWLGIDYSGSHAETGASGSEIAVAPLHLQEAAPQLIRLPARMPGNRIYRHVREMLVGEIAWTVPWELTVDLDLRVWVELAATLHTFSGPRGTVELQLTRIQHGFRAVLYDGGRHSFEPCKIHNYFKYAPVIELVES